MCPLYFLLLTFPLIGRQIPFLKPGLKVSSALFSKYNGVLMSEQELYVTYNVTYIHERQC